MTQQIIMMDIDEQEVIKKCLLYYTERHKDKLVELQNCWSKKEVKNLSKEIDFINKLSDKFWPQKP